MINLFYPMYFLLRFPLLIIFSSVLCSFLNFKKKSIIRKVRYNNIIYGGYKYSNTHENRRHIIITVGYGYSKEKLDIFFCSLKHTGYSGEKLIFINENVDNDTLKYLIENNIEHIFINDRWPYFSNLNNKYIVSPKIMDDTIPKKIIEGRIKIAILRYFLVLAFLTQFNQRYDKILVIDSRDVCFQLDPFSWNIREGISVFEESRKYRIFNQTHNDRWLKKINYSYESTKYNYIINGGSILFTQYEGIEFLKRYHYFYEKIGYSNANDQGMFNAMIYSNFYNRTVNIYRNNNTPIKMLGFDTFKTIRWTNNLIYNDDNSIPAIFHQYDRIPEMRRIVPKLYNFRKDK